MTVSHFDLSLASGRMQLKLIALNPASEQKSFSWIDYDTAQSAIEKAFSQIAHQTGRTQGGEPDEARMAEAFKSKLLRLDISGHQREICVAALHLHVRYGIDLPGTLDAEESGGEPRPPQGGLHLNPIKDAMDGYATFRFDSDLRPLEALRSMLDQWMQLTEREPTIREKAKQNFPRWREILGLGGLESKPLRVVVTGVTGAGKSTFINGLLGRDVVPTSSEVCTAGVLHLRYPAEGEGEYIKIYWRSPTDLQKLERDLLKQKQNLEKDLRGREHCDNAKDSAKTLTKKVKATSELLLSQFSGGINGISGAELAEQIRKRADQYGQRLTALERSKLYWDRGEPTDEELSNLSKFAEVGPDSFAEATSKIEVFIKHPLLKLVEIVDAPGLRDGSDDRQKTLLRAFEGDTAWIYLVPATDRTNSPQEDWRYIQSFVSNGSGILVLTKADTQPSNEGATLVKTMQDREKNHVEFLGWKRPSVWCSAFLTAKMAAISPADIEDHVEKESFNRLTDLLEYPRRKCKERYENYLSKFAVPRQASLQIARDYIFDSSRLPCVMRRIGTVLLEDAIAGKLRRGHEEMMTGVREALHVCRESIASAGRILEAHDMLVEMKKQLGEAKDGLAQAQEALDLFQRESATANSSISSECCAVTDEFSRKIREAHDGLKKNLDEKYNSEMEGCLWGEFQYRLGDYFLDVKNWGNERIKKLWEKTLNSLRDATYKNNGTTRPSIPCEWTFTESKTIKYDESLFESANTAKARWEGKVFKSTVGFECKMLQSFSASVDAVQEGAKSFLERSMKELEERIKERKNKEIHLERQIRENDPQQTRRTTEENLASFQEHQAAFEKFLNELEQFAVS